MSPAFLAFDMAARLFSPYDLNPAGLNPLRDILAACVDADELRKSFRMIALLRQAADPGHEEGAKWAAMRVHLLTSPIMTNLGYSSKLNAEWAFLTMLKEEGLRTVEKFLKNHGDDLGQRSTLNLNVLLEQV